MSRFSFHFSFTHPLSCLFSLSLSLSLSLPRDERRNKRTAILKKEGLHLPVFSRGFALATLHRSGEADHNSPKEALVAKPQRGWKDPQFIRDDRGNDEDAVEKDRSTDLH